MAFQEVVFTILYNYTSALSFVAGLLLGDVLILLAALAGAGKLNIGTIFIFGLLGEITHDVLFFFIGKSRFVKYMKVKLKLNKGENKASALIEKLASTRGGYFVPLFFAKFIYGIRDSVILYFAHKEHNFGRYIRSTFLASICSISIILGLGWLAGQGFNQIIPLFKGFEKGVGLVLVTVLVLYFVYRLIGKLILSETKKYLIKMGLMEK
ncbi:MAG: hypothetical protein AABX11_06705 [Nanoarchaeota archaeon]